MISIVISVGCFFLLLACAEIVIQIKQVIEAINSISYHIRHFEEQFNMTANHLYDEWLKQKE